MGHITRVYTLILKLLPGTTLDGAAAVGAMVAKKTGATVKSFAYSRVNYQVWSGNDTVAEFDVEITFEKNNEHKKTKRKNPKIYWAQEDDLILVQNNRYHKAVLYKQIVNPRSYDIPLRPQTKTERER